MSHAGYAKFSKGVQREKRSTYNFEKSNDYMLAEKWFEERKAVQHKPVSKPVLEPIVLTPELVQHKPVSKPVLEPIVLTPELVQQKNYKPRSDSCDLDLSIPSYENFNYTDPDEIVKVPLQVDLNNTELFQEQYAEEGKIDDNYIGQLAEFEAEEISFHIQEMYTQILACQMYTLSQM